VEHQARWAQGRARRPGRLSAPRMVEDWAH